MKLSLEYNDFKDYVIRQLNNFFPDRQEICSSTYSKIFDNAVFRTEHSFKHIKLKQYNVDGEVCLSHLHSDQYAMFIWFLSNTAYNLYNDEKLASKLFYLNKIMHSFNCMYDTGLPEVFLLVHTIGTVLGKASYSDFFIACQGCTVGAHHNIYPVLGRGVALLPDSAVIGNCKIGNNVSISIKTLIYEKDIEDNHVAFINDNCNFCLKYSKVPLAQRLFNASP